MNLKHTKSYHKGHPNPQFYRDSYSVLDGKWDFVFDDENIGLLHAFYEKFPENKMQINVPYAYQTKESGIYVKDQIDHLWYQKNFNINDVDKRYLIHFLGVDYECDVFINGKYVYYHKGGYDQFSFELTNLVIGENKLVLRVTDKAHIDQLRGKQNNRKNSEGCFYTKTSGVYKEIYIEKVEDVYIKNVFFKADYNTKTLNLDVELNSKTNVDLEVEFGDNNDKYTFKCNKEKETFKITLSDVKGYSFENPYLYDLTFRLIKDKTIVDEVLSYCGFISLDTKGERILINNQDTYLKMILDQGYFYNKDLTPNEEDIILDLNLIKEAGFNGLRKHEVIESPLYMYYADLFGLYNTIEIPSAMSFSHELEKAYPSQMRNIVFDNYNHPSTIGIVLFNESWGINDIEYNKEVADFTEKMYHEAKKISLDRFVISNDGWQHTTSDLLTFHNYAENYEKLDKELTIGIEKCIDGENPYCCGDKKFYVHDYRYNGVPFIFSEFGGIAFNKDKQGSNWGYGAGISSEEEYLNRYKDQLRYIKDNKHIRGFCLTQLTDVEIEVNGILTPDRKPKVSLKRLKELHDQFK